MSDPVTNADIEDVLAQVRRLVLQEQPAPRPLPLHHAPRAPARLVLTPAQRVGEEAESPEMEAEMGAEMGAGAPALVPSPTLAGAERRIQGVKGIEHAVAEALGGAAAWEPDGSEERDWTPGWTPGWPLDDAGEGEGVPPPAFRHRSRAAVPPTARPGAPSSPAPDPGLDPGPPSEPLAAPAAGPLDEDRLRALVVEVVRDVVRAELQGELGERVTRNLRKLVRREVFRVLDGQGES